MWSNSTRFAPDPNYKIPIMKIVIGDDAPDNSVLPGPTKKLRDLPPLPANWQTLLDDRLIFEVQRGSAGGELEWLINGKPFDPTIELLSLKNRDGHQYPATPKKNSFNLWEIRNGGGGWVHPSTCTWKNTARSCGTTRTPPSRLTLATPTTSPVRTSWRSTRPSPRSSTAGSGTSSDRTSRTATTSCTRTTP